MYENALEEFKKEYGRDSPNIQYFEMAIHALKGDTHRAREWIEKWETIIRPLDAAIFWAFFGESEKVFFYLDKAYEKRSANMFILQTLHFFKEYRSDPRYEQLLEKMGLK